MFFCFPGWYGYTLTPFLHKRHRTLIAIIILQYHRLFKIALISYCFPEKKNQQPTLECKLLIFSVDQPGLEICRALRDPLTERKKPRDLQIMSRKYRFS